MQNFGVILLSAGSGSRMNSSIPKQYMKIMGKPVLYYSLRCFEDCPFVKEIVIVASEGDIGMVKKDIVDAYGITKVKKITPGGKERYNSVHNGLKVLDKTDYVMIHDGARPCIDSGILERLKDSVIRDKACIPAVLSKDTIIISDEDGYIKATPDRSSVWNVQTPQTFEYEGIRNAFRKYMEASDIDKKVNGPDMEASVTNVNITDDAMIWELYDKRPVRIVTGDYGNIKLTTPEDIISVENILKNRRDVL